MKNKPRKKRGTFEDQILLKLRRDFTESEAINFVSQQYDVLKVKFAGCQIEKGKLMSTVSELEYQVEKLKEENKKLVEHNEKLIENNQQLQKEIEVLQQENLKLIQATSKTGGEAWSKIFQQIDSKTKSPVSR